MRIALRPGPLRRELRRIAPDVEGTRGRVRGTRFYRNRKIVGTQVRCMRMHQTRVVLLFIPLQYLQPTLQRAKAKPSQNAAIGKPLGKMMHFANSIRKHSMLHFVGSVHVVSPGAATVGVAMSSCPAKRESTRKAAILRADLEAITKADGRCGLKLGISGTGSVCWWLASLQQCECRLVARAPTYRQKEGLFSPFRLP